MAIDHGHDAAGNARDDDDGTSDVPHDAVYETEMEAALRDYLSQVVAQSVYAAPAVADEAICELERWQILAWRGEQHFVGFQPRAHEGRVSSAIQAFDTRARVGVTASGRRYVLLGPAGHDADAEYVLHWWIKHNRVAPSEVRDVTAELIPVPAPGEVP